MYRGILTTQVEAVDHFLLRLQKKTRLGGPWAGLDQPCSLDHPPLFLQGGQRLRQGTRSLLPAVQQQLRQGVIVVTS